MGQLDGRVAVVTGASSGIGYEAARLFAQEGAKLVLVARRRVELDRLAELIHSEGGEAVVVAGAIEQEATARAAVDIAVERFGGLDIAFNNAGAMGENAGVTELSTEGWREVLDINLTSALFAARHQIPAMLARGRGSLIFTSSFVGHTVGIPGMGAYAASKAGLIGLMKVIAAEFGPMGIRANALLPGGTDTPMGRDAAPTPEAKTFVQSIHALKRMAEPSEIARCALFLASDASSFVTGTALMAEGGVSITRT